jgi:hypothetical protein
MLLVGGMAVEGFADTIFTATLTNDQEVPPAVPTASGGGPRPASFGSATLVLNDAQDLLTMTIEVSNIDFTGLQTPSEPNDDITAAHIHAPALPGATAGVVWGFIGMPFNDTEAPTMVVTPFTTGAGASITGAWNLAEGNGTTLDAQLPNLFAGLAYLNFHTIQFPRGEVRGQITRVPEPTALLVLGVGLAALAFTRRRRS